MMLATQNEKLKSIVENMEKCDSSFVLAYMSLSLIGIKDLQTSIKKNFLQDVVNLIKEYSIMADTGENIERLLVYNGKTDYQ